MKRLIKFLAAISIIATVAVSEIITNPNLADGTFDWAAQTDSYGRGSSAMRTISSGYVGFQFYLAQSDDNLKIYTWAGIAAYPESDWNNFTSINIIYNSSYPIVIILGTNDVELMESGAAFRYTLPANSNIQSSTTIPLSSFTQPAWVTSDSPYKRQSIDKSLLAGIYIYSTVESAYTSGAIRRMDLNGVVIDRGEIVLPPAKAPGATVDAPTYLQRSGNSITVTVTPPSSGQMVEYIIKSSGMSDKIVESNGNYIRDLTGLTPNTAYNIYARAAESHSYYEGPLSAALAVTTTDNASTIKQAGKKVDAPTLASKTASSITVTVTTPSSGQDVEYIIKSSGMSDVIVDGYRNTIATFTGLTPNTAYNIYARSKADYGYDAGPLSAALAVTTNASTIKQAGAKVNAPTLASKTHNSITINAVTSPSNGQQVEYIIKSLGMHVMSDKIQNGLTFTGLRPNNAYAISARSKENYDYYQGGNSSDLAVMTDNAVVEIPSWNETTDASWYNSSLNSFTITTAEQLAGLAELVNNGNDMYGKTITLGANIMLNDTVNWKNWATSAPAKAWTPIGEHNTGSSGTFYGTFDGAGYVVSGVYINNSNTRSGASYGLFGYNCGKIKNLGVVASYVKANSSVGGLVGINGGGGGNSNYNHKIDSVIIINCYAAGNVSGSSKENPNLSVGGLVGSNAGGRYYEKNVASYVIDSYATGNVSGVSEYYYSFVGGLVGSNSNSFVIDSYATGNVSGLAPPASGENDGAAVGGLVGGNGNGVVIDNSYATGNVSGTCYRRINIGGLVGSGSNINNSYATGNVNVNARYDRSRTGMEIYAGGLIGQNGRNGDNTNCYATGNVNVKRDYDVPDVHYYIYAGGLTGDGDNTNCYATGNVNVEINPDDLPYFFKVGGLTGGFGKSTNCYYDRQSSGQSDNDGKGLPRTTAQMKQQSTFIDWDFDEIWAINSAINNGYPYLRKTPKGGTPIAKAAANKLAAASLGFAGIRNGQINLNLKAGTYTVQLYNLQGRLIRSVDINAMNGINATGLRIDNFSKGIFVLNVKQAGVSVLKQKIAVK